MRSLENIHFQLSAIASTDKQKPMMQNLSVEPTRISATDGYILATISRQEFPIDELPIIPGFDPLDNASGLIPADVAKKFLKIKAHKHLPLLNHSFLGKMGDQLSLAHTNLQDVTTESIMAHTGYPPIDQVIPQDAGQVKVWLDASLLKDLLTLVEKLTDDNVFALEYYGDMKGLKITATNNNGLDLTAVIMPVKPKRMA